MSAMSGLQDCKMALRHRLRSIGGPILQSCKPDTAPKRWFSRPPRWRRDPLRVGHKLQPRTVLVTGATGFVGRHLCGSLLAQGDRIIVLTRSYERAWNLYGPHAQIVTALDEIPDTQSIDVVINLAGARTLSLPWTAARRRELLILGCKSPIA
jgi:NADPH:quinone reductase-like Zn-dependent oxidoreductase